MNFPFRFAEPEYLVLLVVLPLTWWMARKSLAGLPPARRVMALTLRLAIITLLVLACARMQFHSPAENVAVYFLLDWSDSIPNSPADFRGDILRYVEEASRSDERQAADRVGMIYFGADATCETPPVIGEPPLDRQAIVERSGTDIASAVRLALSTFPPGMRKRVVVVTDGNQNRGDALSEAEAARAQGVRVDVYPVTYMHEREIAVEKFILPDSIQQGVPFRTRVIVRSTIDTKADLTLRRGQTPVRTIRGAVLRKGRNVITVDLKEEDADAAMLAGVVDYRVDVEASNPEDDRIGQNNSAYGFTRLHGPPTILYVDGNIGYHEGYKPILHATLVKELRLLSREHVKPSDEEADVDPRLHLTSLQNIPDEELLVGYDCIILDNVPAEALGPERMERIRSLVNDQGVGLVMIGGEHSFGAGNYLRTPIEEAMPVDMDLKHKKVYPNGALAIVLHTCEFADGNSWAKKITNKAIETLGAHDYVGVLYFDWSGGGNNGYKWLFEMQKATDRGRLQRLVSGCEPGDMPDYDQTLKMAVKGLQQVNAAAKHIIVISDGDPSPPSPAVKRAIANDKTMTLSAIAIGSHSTPTVLQNLATRVGGGRFYAVNDPRKLPRIFIKEALVVKRSLLFEDAFYPQKGRITDTDFVEDVLAAGSIPQLYGYVATSAKEAPGVHVPFVSANENKDPILAHWRYGLGYAVAWTSDAKNRWGRDWMAWDVYGKFWANIVWRILREQPANLKMNSDIEGDRGRIVVQALDKEGNPLSDLDLVAYVSDPDAESLDPVRLRQTGVCTYEADFPAYKVGKYQISVRKKEGSTGPDAAVYGGASVPFSAEMERLTENEPFLRRLAEKGGGAFLDEEVRQSHDLFNRKDLPAALDFQDLWRWLLIAAACLFPLDVFVRRVMIDWAGGYRAARDRYLSWRGRPVPRDERMDRLMEAKKSVQQERARPEFIDRISDDAKDFKFTPSEDSSASHQEPVARQQTMPSVETKKQEPSEDTYTGRLLKAKRRAQDKQK